MLSTLKYIKSFKIFFPQNERTPNFNFCLEIPHSNYLRLSPLHFSLFVDFYDGSFFLIFLHNPQILCLTYLFHSLHQNFFHFIYLFIHYSNLKLMTTTSLSEKDFEYLKRIGSGSFGTVHLVKKLQDDKHFAIKSVQLSQMAQKEKEAALNEVRLLASINIPYVIGYHGAFFDNLKQSLCIVMEFADGGDLQGKIKQLKDTTEEGFQENFVWKVAYEILSGLKILHKNKIIHRDIKSANIFFSDGIAKLGDLNVSKVAEHGMCTTQTGTPYYTSPEIWKGENYTSKCDIWSTGCLLYEMCTLTHPFRAMDFPSLFRKIIVGNYDPIPNKYSQDLQDLVRLCLTVDDYMRPSASELLETSVLRGIDINMDKFDSKGEVNLIDAIRCPQVLKFLNNKLPKPFERGQAKKKTVNFCESKLQGQKTQGHDFKIQKVLSIRKIRSEKVLHLQDEQIQSTLMHKASSKSIKLHPIESEVYQPVITTQNSAITENTSQLKTPLSFSHKKLKTNNLVKRIVSRKQTVIDDTKNTYSSIEKNGMTSNRIAVGSKGLLSVNSSTKKIISTKVINIGENKENKMLL